MIVLLPYGGLGNRIRSINSAIEISKVFNHKLIVFWVKNRELGCKFNELFKKIEDIDLIEVNSSFDLRLIYHRFTADKYIDHKESKELQGNNFEAFKKHNSIFIKSCHKFYNYNNMNCFKPIDNINKVIESFTDKFDSNTIGLHIRRTDNHKAIQISSFDKFIKIIDYELNNNPSTNFYLATDSIEIERTLKEYYGDIMIIYKKELNRKTRDGMIGSLIDLICLSKTKLIYGSYWSSFSDIAAEINNTKKIVVGIDILNTSL